MYALPSPQMPKRSRDSEIALLESISTSLDSYIVKNPKPPQKALASDVSKNAARGFLAAKTLVKNIAKACAQENVALPEAEDESGGNSDLVDALVDEYKGRYSALTKKMLIEGVVRYNSQNGIVIEVETEGEPGEEDTQQKFGRIVPIVAMEMNQYFEKIEALKKSREIAASQPKNSSKKRMSNDNDSEAKAAKPKKPRKEKEPDTPEKILIKEILKRYAAERQVNDRLANGRLEVIVEEAEKELQIDFKFDLAKLDKQIRYRYKLLVHEDPESAGVTNNKQRDIFEEIYSRYSRAKRANGGKLQAGTINAIIEGAKLEYGVTELKIKNLNQKIQARFSRENPEFEGNNPGQLKIGELTEEQNKRRQVLLNEITARYVQEKETSGKKKLEDGTLDRIIGEVRNELGIHDIEVHKETIRGRLNRKSYHVQTLGKDSPYDIIDEPLVSNINSWLSQGTSVTRAQGLNLANQLLKEKNLKDSLGHDIVLDAKWWRNFLDRNKRKLVCAD